MSWTKMEIPEATILEDETLPGMVLIDDPLGWSLYCEHCLLTMHQYAILVGAVEDAGRDARKHLFDYHDSSPSQQPRKEHLLEVVRHIRTLSGASS